MFVVVQCIATHGVARFDTSFVMISMPRCLATPIFGISEKIDLVRDVKQRTLLCRLPKSTPTTAMMDIRCDYDRELVGRGRTEKKSSRGKGVTDAGDKPI